jgi:hypothetical protein
MPQVSVYPLLRQHGDECDQQRSQETRIYETGDGDDFTRWVLLDRWNGGGLTGDGGLIESEEDDAEEGSRLFVRIRFEVRMNVDDESRADGREQTRLQEQVR